MMIAVLAERFVVGICKDLERVRVVMVWDKVLWSCGVMVAMVMDLFCFCYCFLGFLGFSGFLDSLGFVSLFIFWYI